MGHNIGRFNTDFLFKMVLQGKVLQTEKDEFIDLL